MKRAISTTAAALLALGALAGCGDDKKADQASTATTDQTQAPAAPSSGDKEAALKKAAQGYVDALLKGQLAGVVGYLDPKVCDDADAGEYAITVGQIKDVAEGATMKVTAVGTDGDTGGVTDYTLSDNAPDQLRRLVKASFAESKHFAWNYRDGEWYLAGPCEDESPSPAPSS